MDRKEEIPDEAGEQMGLQWGQGWAGVRAGSTLLAAGPRPEQMKVGPPLPHRALSGIQGPKPPGREAGWCSGQRAWHLSLPHAPASLVGGHWGRDTGPSRAEERSCPLRAYILALRRKSHAASDWQAFAKMDV